MDLPSYSHLPIFLLMLFFMLKIFSEIVFSVFLKKAANTPQMVLFISRSFQLSMFYIYGTTCMQFLRSDFFLYVCQQALR